MKHSNLADSRVKQSNNKTRIQQENEKRILLAALEVFSQTGFHGATLDKIARAADMSKPNLLYYFKNKEDIYGSLCQDILENWLGAIGDISENSEPSDALKKYIEAKMELSRKRPFASKVFAMEIISGAPVIGDYLATELRSWVDNQAKIFRAWQERGQIIDVSPYHVFFVIWAVTQTYADFETQIKLVLGDRHLGSREHDRAVKAVTEIILNGLAPR